MAKQTIEPEGFDVSDHGLGAMTADEQTEAMKAWFDANFEDPANETPHDAEDGYLYVWGGPYNALEELSDRFGGSVPDDVIEALASELSIQSSDWAPTTHRHEVERDEDEDDPLPADLPPTAVKRYRALVVQQDRWMSEHFLPYANPDATRSEIQRRLLAASEAMRALDQLGFRYPDVPAGMGHNRPPEDRVSSTEEEEGGPHLNPAEAAQIAGDLDLAAAQTALPQPDVGLLRGVRDRLLTATKAVGIWIAKNLNLAVEEFSKAFGKTLGIAAAGGITAVGIVTAFGRLREAASGLEHIIMAHLPF